MPLILSISLLGIYHWYKSQKYVKMYARMFAVIACNIPKLEITYSSVGNCLKIL